MTERARTFSKFAILASLVTFAGCAGSGNNNNQVTGVTSWVFVKTLGTGVLNQPDAIALDATGNIYIANFGSSKITVLGPTGTHLRDFGNTGTTATGLLSGPQGIYVTGSAIFVADANNQRIVVYDMNGNFQKALFQGAIGFPYQINADASGNLYVATSNGPDGKVIREFTSGGVFVRDIGKSGPAAGVLQDPDGVAFDSKNNMFVADFDRKQVIMYDTNRNFVENFGSTGPFALMGPQGCRTNNVDDLFVADLTGNQVVEYDTNQNVVASIGDSSGPGQLSGPYDVVIDKAGEALIVDEHNNRVAVFKKTINPDSKRVGVRTLTPRGSGPHH